MIARSLNKAIRFINPGILWGMMGILILLFACTSAERDISDITADYYRTYEERSDFDTFLSFYDKDMVLEDIMLGERIIGRDSFALFFDWNNPKFAKKESTALRVEKQIIQGKQVVTQGYFTPFRWGETEVSAMYFTTILTFNEKGKIIRHVDWINYPNNLLDYDNRKDANLWIKP